MLKKISRITLSALKLFGTILPLAPELLLKRKRALKEFKSQLRKNNLDEETIRELSKAYKELGKISDWFITDNNPMEE